MKIILDYLGNLYKNYLRLHWLIFYPTYPSDVQYLYEIKNKPIEEYFIYNSLIVRTYLCPLQHFFVEN